MLDGGGVARRARGHRHATKRWCGRASNLVGRVKRKAFQM